MSDRTVRVSPDLATIVHANARLDAQTGEARREADVLTGLVSLLTRPLDLDAMLHRVMDGAQELCGCDQTAIALRTVAGNEVVFRCWSGAGYPSTPIEPGQGGGGAALATGRPFRTENCAEDPRITKDDLSSVRPRQVMAQLVVPIVAADSIEGLFYAETVTISKR